MLMFSLPELTFLRKQEPKVMGYIYNQVAASHLERTLFWSLNLFLLAFAEEAHFPEV